MQKGTWVYVLWSPLSAQVYVGQSGGFGETRSVFDRFRDHILLARDWGLLAKFTHGSNIPVYNWVNQVGLHNVCVTPLQRCTPASVSAVEKMWTRRFGVSHLLNKQLPSYGNERWRWLFKIKSAIKLAQTNQPHDASSLRTPATQYLQGLRSNLSLEQKLMSMLDARRYLPHEVAGPLATKVRAHITRDTGYKIPPVMVLRIPLLRRDQRSFIADLVLTELRAISSIPVAFVEYMRRIIRVVPYPFPKCTSFFRSFNLKGCTDDLLHDHVLHPVACNCQALHDQTGVPMVNGHILTRSFDWLASITPPADPRVFQQCLKNAVLPAWSRVEHDSTLALRRTLDEIPGLSERHKKVLLPRVMAHIQTLYRCAKREVSVIHHEKYIACQLKLLPVNLILGFFDKGATVLWAACHNLFVPNIFKSFFNSPHRFTELLRCDCPLNASINAYTWLTGSLSRFFFPANSNHPTPPSTLLYNTMTSILSEHPSLAKRGLHPSKPFLALLQGELKTASRRYDVFMKRLFSGKKLQPPRKRKRAVTQLVAGGTKRPRANSRPQQLLTDPVLPLHSSKIPRPLPRCFRASQFATLSVVVSFLDGRSIVKFLCSSKMLLWHTARRLLSSTVRLLPWHSTYSWIHSVFDILVPPSVTNPAPLVGTDDLPRYSAPVPPKSSAKCIPTPNAQLLFKFKSQERALPPIMKFREVLAYAAHPFPRVVKLVGRALTVFWKLVVRTLCPREIISMTEILSFLRSCVSKAPRPRRNQQRFWVEFDLVEMFPNIERHLVIDALKWLHAELLRKMDRRLPLNFFIAKGGNRKLDTWEKGSSTDFYFFSFDDVLSYVIVDLKFNSICRILSSLIIQTTGTRIGGSLSAKIASLVLIYRELRAKGTAKRELDQVLWCRYRDNFSVTAAVTLRPNEPVSATVARRASTIQKHLKSVFNMRVTLEQWGHEIDYLESRLGDVQGPTPLRVKSTQWTCSPGTPTPPRPQKLIDPTAPNARDMVRTFVPNEVKKSAWYRLSPVVATENLSQLVTLLNAKSYPPTWWTQPLRRSATRWGLKLPSGSLGGPVGEPSERRGARCASSTRAVRRAPHDFS